MNHRRLVDRVTGQPPTVYTPPEDIMERWPECHPDWCDCDLIAVEAEQ